MIKTDDKGQEKRRRVVEAAWTLILRHGLRGTTMEAIARAAKIAKPTLYAHFADKDAVFSAVVDTLMDDLLAAFDTGMALDGDVALRVGEALAGQYAVLAQALAGSPHATELMGEHKRAGMRFREKDLRAEDEIADALRAANAQEPDLLARVICAAAYGIALKTSDGEAMRAAIMLMSRRMIEGALPA